MTIQKSKITLSDFKPKRIASEPDTVNRLFVGTLVGRATGVVRRTDTNKQETYEGLGGLFEANVTGSDAPVQSGVLFMPDTFINSLIAMLSDKTDSKTGEIITPAADAVQVAYKVFVVRDGNPQGYSWQLESIVDPTVEKAPDPLEALRKLVAPTPQAQLTDKTQPAEGEKKSKK
jgi:hypothetical protein